MDFMPKLSYNDRNVLDLILDTHAELHGKDEIRIDCSLPADPYIADAQILSDIRKQELLAIALAEKSLPKLAALVGSKSQSSVNYETEEFRKIQLRRALDILSEVISKYPNYASAYNNRAQIMRMYCDNTYSAMSSDRCPCSYRGRNEASIINDLNTAIALASPNSGALSTSQAKVLAQAYTQRGAYWQRVAKSKDKKEAENLLQASNDDLVLGGRYGNEIARALAVLSNPYAKLCGQMVREALQRDYGHGVSSF